MELKTLKKAKGLKCMFSGVMAAALLFSLPAVNAISPKASDTSKNESATSQELSCRYNNKLFYINTPNGESKTVEKLEDLMKFIGESDYENTKIAIESEYTVKDSETVNVPAGKNITFVRGDKFISGSMFSIPDKATLNINAPDSTSSITFDGNNIETNVYNGGAFSVSGTLNITGSNTINNIIVTGNHVIGSSGGICNYGTANISNCNITNNSAQYGGGIYNEGTATVSNCTITGNSASCCGGGINNSGGTVTISNCDISGNSAGCCGGDVCAYKVYHDEIVCCKDGELYLDKK